jgi:hypothetical protein
MSKIDTDTLYGKNYLAHLTVGSGGFYGPFTYAELKAWVEALGTEAAIDNGPPGTGPAYELEDVTSDGDVEIFEIKDSNLVIRQVPAKFTLEVDDKPEVTSDNF